MNQKELNEIRRRIRPEHNNIRNIYGCYVNTAKEIISSFDASTGLLSQDEAEKYFFLLKKTLSGALGKNLAELEFETRSVAEGKDLRLLSAMLAKGPGDDVLRDEFFRSIISSIDMQDQNYLILLAQDIYDVPQHTKDGEADDRGDVYRYLLCSICPVKSGKAELGYSAEDRRFCTSSAGQIAAAPECGFLYPAFDGRTANLYGALLYSRNINLSHQDLADAVFHASAPMCAGEQKETFEDVLTGALKKNCTFDVIQAMHEQLSERIEVYKESKDPEPMTITCEEMGEILEKSGAESTAVETFTKEYRKKLGDQAVLRPGNLVNAKKMEISLPEVKISVDPKFGYLVQTMILDGKKYIVISADSGVEINGVSVSIAQ